MNMKDLVVPVSFALVTVFALNYFFPSASTKKEVESSFIAPREKKEYKPLNVEVDFFDQKQTTARKSKGDTAVCECATADPDPRGYRAHHHSDG